MQQQQLAEEAAGERPLGSSSPRPWPPVTRIRSLGKLLAVEALNVVKAPTSQSTSMLHQVLAADPVIAHYQWPDQAQLELSVQLDPSGTRLVASGGGLQGSVGGAYPTTRLEVADATTGAVLWSWPHGTSRARIQGFIGPSWFSADGTQVIAGLYWGDDFSWRARPSGVSLGVAIWDAKSGELQRMIDVGPCGGRVSAVSGSRLLVWRPVYKPRGLGGCAWPNSGEMPVESVTWSPAPQHPSRIGRSGWPAAR